MSSTALQDRLDTANRLARAAGQLTLRHFQTVDLAVQKKGDGSPLTVADQEAERFLRAEIEKAFPDDGIVGEEFGETAGRNGIRWILDPIDGTKSFISGVPLFGTMVGVEVDGEACIGALYFPGLDEGISALHGGGAWHVRGTGEPKPARVSRQGVLAESILVTSEVETFAKRGAADGYAALADSVYVARTWGDAYGYLLVATGRVEIMIDPMLNVWDAAAVKPIIEEAGGRFSDWRGASRIDGGDAIGTNGLVHDRVLEILRAAVPDATVSP